MKCIDAINQFTCVPLSDYNKIANGRELISGMDWCVIGCDVMKGNVMWCGEVWYDLMWWGVTPCDAILCGNDVTRYDEEWRDEVWCDEV